MGHFFLNEVQYLMITVKQRFLSFLTMLAQPKVLIGIVVFIALGISLQSIFQGTRFIAGGEYTHYNNYLIFKQSFFHLIESKDVYGAYPKEHFDYFKYSPTFALLFGMFAYLPDIIGLSFWNLCNLLALVFALISLPNLKTKWLASIFLLSIFEIITTTQNEQSNALMLALFIFTFSSLERKKYFLAACFIGLAIYTKLYAIVGLSLFLLYPNRIKNMAYLTMVMTALFCLPLLVVEWSQLIFQYKSWLNLLSLEHDQIYGISVMGWLHTWFSLSINKFIPVIVGVLLFCLALFQFKKYQFRQYRLWMLCSVLIWVVIFNHRAESASYIIAYVGICLWFVTSPINRFTILLMGFSFVLVTLSPTDLFPRIWREQLVQKYTLKAVPVMIVWIALLVQMIRPIDHSIQEIDGELNKLK